MFLYINVIQKKLLKLIIIIRKDKYYSNSPSINAFLLYLYINNLFNNYNNLITYTNVKH
jgi:hypothetical protein